MAVAHLDRMDRFAQPERAQRVQPTQPVYVRRYNPGIVRDPDEARAIRDARVVSRPVRGLRVPRRALLLGIVLGGGFLQHVLVSTPLEAAPTPLTVAAGAMAAAPSAAAPALSAAPGQAVARVGTGGGTTEGIRTGAQAAPGVSGAFIHSAVVVPVALKHGTTGTTTARAAVVVAAGRTSVLSFHLPPVGLIGDRARGALATNQDGDIMHAPSVSVTAIRDALQAAGSPLLSATFADQKDAAEYIWDEGRVLGVDPAVLMGIFQHESGLGAQGMARQTNSIGNIRPVGNQPQLAGYRLYSSWQEGIDDCYRLLRSYVRGGATTVASAIPVWAPPSDNNDDSAYISSVLDTMGSLAANSGQ